jgi:hypothetical protein
MPMILYCAYIVPILCLYFAYMYAYMHMQLP